jgi:titin
LERVRGTSFAFGTDRTSRNLAPNTSSVTEGGLQPGTTYTFRVFSYNSGGDSEPAPEAGATTLPEAPAPPSGLAVTPLSASSLKLDWSDQSSNETGFRIERATGGGAFGTVETVGADVTTFTNSGLSSNTSYRFRVRAINGVSVSTATDEAAGLTYPAVPAGLSATALSATQVRLNWSDASAAPTAFQVYRKTTGGYSLLATTTVGATLYVDGAAAAATAYTYQLRATNATGDSAGSNEASVTTPPAAPTAPSGLTVTVVSRSSLLLNWNDNSSNEDAFRIERSSPGVPFRVVASVGSGVTTFTDTGLAANTTYSYRVKAANAGGESAPTDVKSATTLPELPAGVTGLEVTTVSQTELRLTWSDVSSDETGFKIERSPDGTAFTQIATVGANVTAYASTGLAANTKYYYRVRATNAGGDSGYSNVASATTLPNPPAAPGSLAVSVLSSRSLRVSWVDASNNETAFQVERSLDGNTFTPRETLPENVTQFDDTGLARETTYYYRVRALNAGGGSAPTAVASGRTPADPPGAPSGLTATVLSASSIRLDWTDPGSTETGFRLDRSVNGGDFAEVRQTSANQTTVTDTGLAANTAYTYRVRAVNAGGSSAPSSLTTGLTLPTAPVQLTAATVSASRIDLTWIDSNPQPAGTRIERAQGDSGFTERGVVTPGTLTFSDTGLAANTTYTYRVRARNDSGVSDPSPTAPATTLPAPPAAPSGLTALAAGAGTLRLQWQDQSGNETGFKIERALGGEGYGQIATVGAGETTYLDSGLQPSQEYVYRVRAYNGGGDSDYSLPARATTAPNAPGAPTELTVTTGTRGRLELSWRDNSTTESGFQIERSPDGDTFTQVGTAAENVTRYSDTGLSSGVKFYYRVRAVNTGGSSGYSNVAQGTTLPEAPSAPTGLTGTPSVTSVRLTWTDTSSNEEGFVIERREPGSDAFVERFRVSANRTEYAESGLPAGTTYTYRVRAFNGGGISAPAEARVTTLTGLLSLTLRKSSIKGTKQVEGVVTLTGPAPSSGVVVTLTSGSELVHVPASVKVRARKSTITFKVKTKRVRAEVKATLTARYAGQSVTAPLTVKP